METRHFLTGWEETTNVEKLGVRQRIFGHLVVLAIPTLERYHSDLYHDVHWIDKYVNGPCTFYFGFDSCGTAIGDSEKYVRQSRPDNVYRITLEHVDHAWYLQIEQLTTAA